MADPDEPTRRLPPTRPAAAEPRVAYTEADDVAWRELLLDRFRSLRTAVALLGVVAVAALGVALWALLSEQDEGGGDRGGASASSVSRLEDRVDELESAVERAPSRDDLSGIREGQRSIEQRLDALEQAGEGSQDAQQAVEDLQQSVQDLEQRVDELEQQQEDQSQTP
jgi:archaellum component FlaC